MARRRYYGRRRRRFLPSLTLLGVAVVGGWWLYPREQTRTETDRSPELAPVPLLTTDRPDSIPDNGARVAVAEKGDNSVSDSVDTGQATPAEQRAASLMAAGKEALDKNDAVSARSYYSEALRLASGEQERSLLRAELTRLGNETIFSHRVFDGDPFVQRYVIQPGDTLGKIAKANKVSSDLLASINGIHDKNRIRAGQSVKIIRGPFHAAIDTGTYTLGVYLGETFVKNYRVGLGMDDSTPRGEWRVSTKLKNPTYYPPRGGRIIPADDPDNPLGERWIGLEGVAGEAAGQLRYGIHGTNEPDTIGQSVSLGCIRMYNEDVEDLYTYLVEKESTVIVR